MKMAELLALDLNSFTLNLLSLSFGGCKHNLGFFVSLFRCQSVVELHQQLLGKLLTSTVNTTIVKYLW